MSFVPDIPPEDFAPELQYAVRLDVGGHCRTASIFHKVAHSPAVFLALADATSSTLRKMKLDPELRELAICTVTSINRATYPYSRHVQMSQQLGISEEKLLALPVGERHPAFSDKERAVLCFARELTVQSWVSPETKAWIAGHFDHAERVELAWTVGFYNAVSRLTNACDVELETGPAPGMALR
jgi:alkylhydroperoxidase family enzyme